MKPTHPHVRQHNTSTVNWLATSILVFASLISILQVHGQSQAKIDSLLNVIKNAPEDTTLALNLKTIGCSYGDISNFKLALKYGDSALALSEKLNFPKGLASAHLCISRTLISTGDFEKAREHAMLASEFSKKAGARKTQAYAYLNLSSAYARLDNYAEALKSSRNALDISLEINDQRGIVNAYNNLGVISFSMGNYPDALNYQMDHLKIVEGTGNKNDLFNAYNNIAVIYGAMGNDDEKLFYITNCLRIAEESGNKELIATAKGNMGQVLKDQGKNEEALEYYNSALRILDEIGDKNSLANTYNNIGVLNLELGNYQAAKENFLLSIQIREKTGSQAGISLSCGNLGKASLFLGEYQNARTFLEKGLSVAKSIGNKGNIMFNYRWMYALDSAVGNYKQAFAHYKQFHLYWDSLYNEENTNQVAQLKIEYETEKKDKEIELLNKDNEIKSLQLSKQKAIRHGMIAGIVLLSVTAFLLFRSFRLRKKLEQQQAIISERKRISADLHDDVGSGLSRIMLLTELVKNEAKTPETQKEAEKIAAISKELSANISEIIWALNANNDYLESLVAYIRRYAAEFFDDSAVSLKINSTGTITGMPISGELRREIFYTVKEALHNIYKHARATEAELVFSVRDGMLTITIRDNGVGLPEKETGQYGNGLTNMQQRMESAGGSFSIENHQGTKITLVLPVS